MNSLRHASPVEAATAIAADLSQTTADVVFQGGSLAAVANVLTVARRARAAMRQNIAFSIAYNAVMLPLVVAAMSSSSLIVISNSFRLNRSPQ